ncbi:FixH family protein [Solitalea canadensis]|uniref:FixH protein n=1 Tax=Solitalea canadensis (strain ATCC 29591 / DSM 3403 / JCM 21819 / LMG 8368 / NBRC 15130 / NCIMB 12057 / USAM 9D) TaxID=929556 RepID=H8KTM3_SOLCM|nr:FixH family protein [Solitalea canadensis]AFD06481.1 hypothetical protein Solca_1395 [Solitalea canadensis DSM 3403]
MKLGWGTITALFYCSFVVFMLGLVYLAMREKFELVTPNYYAEELKYQHKIDAAKNANQLSEMTDIQIVNKSVTINLPKEFDGKVVTGQIYFFRPSDGTKDLKVELKPDDSGKQVITNSSFIKGLYKIKLDWKCDGKDYFLEQNIFFQ